MLSLPSYGDNSKAAVIRIGLKEMIAFANRFYDDVQLETFFESCGVADLITTCYGGRNRIAGEEFVKGKVRLGKCCITFVLVTSVGNNFWLILQISLVQVLLQSVDSTHYSPFLILN